MGREDRFQKGAFILASVLALTYVCGTPAQGPWTVNVWAASETISISTVEELMEFGRNCTSESYSKGKAFVLEADLNLQGTDFQPIPVFAGTFDGGGHAVAGLSIKDAGSDLGLFRFVQPEGTVKNLSVYGNLAPQGSRTNIGGIAGTNRGTLENCRFEGEIMAADTLGGIAGRNEETGVIIRCENGGQLTGNLKTGGIAGYNEGHIEECVNRGDVNATGKEVSGDSTAQLPAGSTGLEESVRVERVNDAGGIAGLSLGYIKDCSNYGAVGYPHMGYNMGGIAGRQSGLVDRCRNYGRVRGRKDAGGIVGQFEPYVSVDYEEDMFGSLETQIQDLSDMGDSLSGMIEQAGDTASDNLDQIDAQVGKMRDIGRFYKDLYRQNGDRLDRDMDQSIDDIQNILDGMDLEMAGPATRSHYQAAREKAAQIKDLKAQMDKGYEGDVNDAAALREWLEKRQAQLAQLAAWGQELTEELAWLAANAPGDAAGGLEDFTHDLNQVQTETANLTDIVRYNTDKARNDLHNMDEEMMAQADNVSGSVDTFTDGLRDSRNQIRSQKDQIMNQLDVIQDTISDGVERAKEDRELFEDVSDLEGEGPGQGMVNGCTNEGAVTADYQAGGIVGIIGMETSLDPEQDLEAKEERTLNVTRNIKAIVLECINWEQITVTNDYAGGIAGKANLGALIQNQNYGDITAEDGSYVGGITGSSAYVLRRNYSMCTVDGSSYTGGIAGWGTDILDNYSMVSFATPHGEWMGCVAGDADEEGIIQGNFYVDENLGAVDGVTYDGQAQGLPYGEFLAMEGMPGEFGSLSVEFLVEDQVLKTVYCQYGEGVPEEEIPQVPQKDGYYYEWEEKDLSDVRGNQKVRAVYKAWNTTIASSDDKMPVMLAEANFYPGTTLVLEKQGGAEDEHGCMESVWLVPDGYRVKGVYAYSILQPEGVAVPEKITVHVLAQGYKKNCAAGILADGNVSLADSRRDGPYLVFDMSGAGTFVILEPEGNQRLRVILAVCGFVAAAVCIVTAAGKKKRRQREKTGEADEAGQSDEAGQPEEAGEADNPEKHVHEETQERG